MPRQSKRESDEPAEPRREADDDKYLDDDESVLDAADSGALSGSLESPELDDEFDEDDFDDDFDDDFEPELDDELDEDLGEFDEQVEGDGADEEEESDDDDLPFDEEL